MNYSKKTANLFRKTRSLRVWQSLFIIHCSLSIHHPAFAQIGTWQYQVSYRPGRSVAVVGSKIYAATQNGFFYYDKTTGETITRSKAQNLSDVSISRLLYLADQKRLLIAYRNGDLDFLSVSDTGEPGDVLNLNTIATATNLPASRTINHLNRVGNSVYLSTDFGLVVLDLTRNEIRDTYFSRRPDGSPLPILQTAATTDSLFALTGPVQPTDTGRRLRAIRFAPGVNLADPANWQPVSIPGATLESIVVAQNRLLASVNGAGVFERQAGRWVLTQRLTNLLIRLFPAQNGVSVATNESVTTPGVGTVSSPLLADPREVATNGNQIWIITGLRGLLKAEAGRVEQIAPEGPTQDAFSRLYDYPQTLVALPAGPQTTNLLPAQPSAETFSVPNARWQTVADPPNGFNSAAYLPDGQRLFLSNFGGGLWRQADGQPPVSVALPATVAPFISSLAADPDGDLWITTAGPNAGRATLHVLRRPDGQFQSFPTVNQTNLVQVLPDDNGFLWLRPDAGGLTVFDPKTNRIQFLSTQRGQGGLLSNNVLAMVKDRNGVIWIGTDLGPAVFDNPAGAFDGAIDAQPPLLNRRRLLANEQIMAIAVDGGNRKWLGTRTGLYHVAPDGSQLLDVFTTDNSPLPANVVTALAIEPTSGRVFILTDKGIVSYGGPATEPAETLSGLTIFPNPVRPDFTGTVGINGLTDNATVKILDAGGQLVYETRSQGGTATWNLRDYRGRPAQTSIYLIVVVSADGSEGLAGKLAVMR